VAAAAGVDRPWQTATVQATTWGLGFFDLDLDGWQDVFVSAGSLPLGQAQPDEVFVSDGAGAFLDLTAPSGMGDPSMGRGTAFADYDRDGRMDLYVTNLVDPPKLFQNITPLGSGYHWLEVRAVGTVSNRDGCGALVTVTVKGARLLRPVLCASSLGSGDDHVVHFGLGTARVRSVQVVWPSGITQTILKPSLDGLLDVVEGA
jgi:hypothetical protein